VPAWCSRRWQTIRCSAPRPNSASDLDPSAHIVVLSIDENSVLDRHRAAASSSYPAAELSHFPDPISRLVDAERRAQFMREGVHLRRRIRPRRPVHAAPAPPEQGGGPDLRRRSGREHQPGRPHREQFKKAIADLEDTVGDAVNLRRMGSYTHTCRLGREHLRDHLTSP